jgi:putative endopeptidase
MEFIGGNIWLPYIWAKIAHTAMRLTIAFLQLGFVFALTCCTSNHTESLPEGVGIKLENIDSTVRPQDDFFAFVNGGWLNKTEIPPDQGRWGSFNELQEFNNDAVLKVLKKAGENSALYPEGTDQRKAADFYSIGMDSMLVEKAGTQPVHLLMESIEAIDSKDAIPAYQVANVLNGGSAFFDFEVFPDLMDSKKMSGYFSSGGLGLPEKDYYLNKDEKSVETREQYKQYLSRLFVLGGEPADKAAGMAAAVLAIETKLAQAMLSKEDRRNPAKLYNPQSMADLAKLVPSIDWKQYFSSLNISVDTVIVTEPAYLKAYSDLVNSSSLADLKTYLKAALLRRAATYLNHEFVQASFDFNGKYLRGTDQMLPRWKRVLAVTNAYLGEAIGQLYVEENFPPEAKEKALEMVENIKLAFADRIRNLDWMSDSTKQTALAKLDAFSVKIGYPDKWKDYSELEFDKSPENASYFANVLHASRFKVREEIDKLGKPVDKTEWRMTPQTVNAYYNPLFNEIVFPAGILQPPFYDYRADDAVNYGGIGSVIGHELSHGFDDQGSQFDGDGNMKNWWAEADLEKFREKGKAYVDQFNAYEPLPGVFVQGQFTLGENIGDLGGLAVSYEGLQRHYAAQGRPDNIDGLTPEQRFFMSWGTIWRSKSRDETLRTQVQTDPHSPEMYRSNGPLSNFDPFYEAFHVVAGDSMYRPPEERVKIW